MKKYNCPFCQRRLDDDLISLEVPNIKQDIVFFCSKASCPGRLNIYVNDEKIVKWSFRFQNFKIVNTIRDNYCYCSKNVPASPIVNMPHWKTIFESDAWLEDPFDKNALLEKLNFCLTYL